MNIDLGVSLISLLEEPKLIAGVKLILTCLIDLLKYNLSCLDKYF